MRIEINNHIIDFEIQYAKRKKLYIHIAENGFITVKAPRETSEATVINAVKLQGNWILEKLAEIEKYRSIPRNKIYEDQEEFLYLGKQYKLNELINVSNLSQEELKIELKKFYFSSCKKIVAERVNYYQKQLGVKPKCIDVIESKVKWGSCSWDKKLCFNFQLAMAPVEIIDYVVVHELCHITHMNHDRSFWRRVGSIIPDYKKREEFLQRLGKHMSL